MNNPETQNSNFVKFYTLITQENQNYLEGLLKLQEQGIITNQEVRTYLNLLPKPATETNEVFPQIMNSMQQCMDLTKLIDENVHSIGERVLRLEKQSQARTSD